MKKKNISNYNILNLTPKCLLEHEVNKDGLINILVPRFKIEFLQKLIPKKISPYINANLDELGSAVWELINGNRSVVDIADKIKEKKGEIEQVYERVGFFFQQLYRNNFITFVEIDNLDN